MHDKDDKADATGGVDPTPPDPGFTDREDLERQRAELHANPGITIWIEIQKDGQKKGIAFKIAEGMADKAVEAQIRGIFKQAVEHAVSRTRELLTKATEE